ncbi:sulfatase-like hydrolase/transferase [Haloferula chungangensis]|uniref:Sulfatase-like hydrolase/transferase n=1 Tax=Haloferula chungangensis TaxID=1048331 RepID=A0ABW2L793_9BACT
MVAFPMVTAWANPVVVPIGDGGTQIEAGASNPVKENLISEAGQLWGVSNNVSRDGMWYFTYSDLSGGTFPSTIQAGTYTFSARVGASSNAPFPGLNDLSGGSNTDAGCVAGFFSSLNGDAEVAKNNMVAEFNSRTGVTYLPPSEPVPAATSFTTWTFTWIVEEGSPVIGSDPYFGVYTKIGSSGGSGFWDDSALSYSTATEPPPTINRFSADHTYVQAGDPVLLSWNVANAETISISGLGNVEPSGSTIVNPATRISYTLVATNSSGSDEAEIEIKVGPERPNILLMLVDDYGPMDSSVPFAYNRYDDGGSPLTTTFNQYYRTPNMEVLAANGMKFTQAYAMPMCSPTRVSLMTGMNSPRHGVTVHLNVYQTVDNASFGIKTHRGPNHWRFMGMDGSDTTLPQLLKNLGYHTFHVGKDHMSHLQSPTAIGFDVSDSALYKSTVLTPKAASMIESAVVAGRPFFGYISYQDVHSGFYYASDVSHDYAQATPPAYNANHAKFSTMVESVDNSLGTILEKLDELGVAEDTLIIFLGDNGSDSPALSDEFGAHGTSFDDFPMRGKKGSAYEGGIRIPLYVSWAARDESNGFQKNLPIPAASVEHDIVTVEDVAPTILSLLDQPAPGMDGYDLIPYLRAEAGTHRPQRVLRHMPHEHRSNYFTAFREGDWKIIYRYHMAGAVAGSNEDVSKGHPSFELFNLAEDPYEVSNLASSHPGKLLSMARSMARELDHSWGSYGPLWPVSNPTLASAPARPLVDDPFFIDFGTNGLDGIDVDQDGLADAIEDLNQNGLVDFAETDPDDGDSDDDRFSDGDEMRTGTDPLSAASFFQLGIESTTPSSMLLTWPSAPGASYRIEASTDLNDWNPVFDHLPATDSGSSTSQEIDIPESATGYFLRVRLLSGPSE